MRFLLTFLLLLGWAGGAWATLSVVQSTSTSTGGGTNSGTVTLGSSPTAGNILVVFIYQNAGANGVGAPDGTWTQIDALTNGGGISIYSFWHPVSGGDGKSYTFTCNYNEMGPIFAYEITGANTLTPINQHSIVASTWNPSSFSTNSVTPNVIGTLGISNAGCSWGGTSLSSVSGGWQIDQNNNNNFYLSSKTSLTTDTSTAISNTFSFGSTSGACVADILLIAPGASIHVSGDFDF